MDELCATVAAMSETPDSEQGAMWPTSSFHGLEAVIVGKIDQISGFARELNGAVRAWTGMP